VVKVEAPPPDVSQPEQSAPPSSSTPLTGIFLQLEATTRMQAETMVAALHGNGFASLSTEIPERAGTYRVLVGPVHSGGLIKLRADLEAAGFPGKVGMIRLY
jgi:cell division septation protein DedD